MNEAIAVIGMACRYPGAENIIKFWDNLVNGLAYIADPVATRSHHLLPRLRGGFLDHVNAFDADFFGVDHADAPLIDPQHRHLLEVTWCALEDAGYDPMDLAGTNTCAIIGLAGDEYDHQVIDHDENPSIRSHLGVHPSVAAGRLSQFYDLRGKSITINTACSSALTAIESACQELWLRHSDLAIVGSANLLFAPHISERLLNSGWISGKGLSRSMDADDDADGYVRSEGVGVIVLKPYAKAKAENDRIYAVITESCVRHNGRGNGLSLPSMQAQIDLLKQIYANPLVASGIQNLVFIETNTVGAPLADVVELKALGHVIGKQRPINLPLRIGCLKPNIGNSEGAAGMAAFIKVVLMLHRRIIPPTIHFKSTIHGLELDKIGLQVQTECEPISADIPVAKAGVSSFGFGGANAHLLLQEADRSAGNSRCLPTQIVLLSARTPSALFDRASGLRQYLLENKEENFANLCFTLNSKRHVFEHRLAIEASSVLQLTERLQAFLSCNNTPNPDRRGFVSFSAATDNAAIPRPIGFIFTGFCALEPHTFTYLRNNYALFREAISECEEVVRARIGIDLAAALDPQSSPMLVAPELQGFLTEYVVQAIWKAWGIEPTHCIGHGLGQLGAAVASGMANVQSAFDWLLNEAPNTAFQTSQPAHRTFFSMTANLLVKPGDVADLSIWLPRSFNQSQDSFDLASLIGFGPMVQIRLASSCLEGEYEDSQSPRSLLKIDQLLWGLVGASKAGLNLDLQLVGGYQDCRLLTLPPYPFERKYLDVASSSACSSNQPAELDELHHQPVDLTPHLPNLEDQLHALWSVRLRTSEFDSTEHFESLGGNSSIADQLRLDIQSRFGYSISAREFFSHPTVAAQASLLRLSLHFDESLRRSTGRPSSSGMAPLLAPPRLEDDGEPAVEWLEALVAATFAAVLKRPLAGRQANFFALGGDSLAGMRVMLRLERQLGNVLEPTLLFQHPTAASLAERLRSSVTQPGLNDSAACTGNPQMIPIRADVVIPPALPLTGDWPSGCNGFMASFAQTRLWFLHQLMPDLCAYHLPALWRLHGHLDRTALESALSDLFIRHPTLRSSFQPHGDAVAQILHPAAPFHLTVEVLQDRDSLEVIEQWVEHERTTPFVLSSGLLLRARLLQVQDNQHLLLINHHHIASDGWSFSVLTRDLCELYNAHLDGRASVLQPLPVHYHDHAAWQRQQLSGDRLQSLRNYWIPQLRGLQPLELPGDYPRPPTPTHRGASLSFQIAPWLLAAFEGLCRQVGATLQMGMLAALAVLLHRYSRQDDMAIGVPIWGRTHADVEPLIGCFINTLPIRTRLQPQQTFRQFLQQVRDTSLEAYAYQELPFEQIVEAVQPERDTSRNPLFQVMLQFLNVDLSLQNLKGLRAEPLNPSDLEASCRLDLEILFLPGERGVLHGQIRYSTDLFAPDRIQRLSDHLLTVLASVLQAPDATADSLCLLPDPERLLIESWQNGPTITGPDLCVHQLFEQQVECTPQAIALISEDQHFTYQNLNARANQLAYHLIALGVGPEVTVAVCLERSVELIVSLLAILKAGGAYLPVDPSWPSERLQTLFSLSQTKLVVGNLRNSNNADALKGLACVLLADLREPTEDCATNPQRAIPQTTAYVLFTSGSTGTPKGVAIDHQALANRLAGLQAVLQLHPGSTVLGLTSAVFDISIVELIIPLAFGARIVLADEQQRRDPDAIQALLRTYPITLLQATPSALQSLVDSAGPTRSNLTILAGGEALATNLAYQLCQMASIVWNGYGPTEATIYSSLAKIQSRAHISIGRPLANTSLHILDPAGQPCPIGIPGELHIGGAGLARGYLNNPELTAKKFIPNPFSSDSTARLYKSGDLASWNSDGTIAFHGRIDQQIKLRGFRIEPGEIEANLLAHPAVAQAVVVLRNDDPSNLRLIAYWVADAFQPTSSSASSEQLRTFLADRLPDYMVPAAFLQLEALPLTANGKLDRQALPAPSFSGNLKQRVAPSTDLERQLHAIWSEVLGHSDFGVTDNFFVIGGHSLAAARLLAAIEESFAIFLPMATLFHSPEICLMARRMESTALLSEDINSCLVPLQAHGECAPLFVIHGYGGDVFCYTDFARALAPDRPVYGLQAMGIDGTSARHRSVEEMAAHYATLIDQQWPSGELHLLGQSAGGWVVWAVAAALLRLGRRIGMVAILDSGPTAAIAPRLRWSLLLRRTLRRLPMYIQQLSHSKQPRNLLGFLRQRRQQLANHLRSFQPEPYSLPTEPPPRLEPGEGELDYYDLLHRRYRPTSLPLRVHLFLSMHEPRLKHRLWRTMACKGVVLRQLFEEHHHFHTPSLAGQLAAAIDETLTQIEAEIHATQNAAGLE